MRQYFEILKVLGETVRGEGKPGWIFLMLFSAAAYVLVGLLPPLATAGIIRVVTEGEYQGIFKYVILYIVFYMAYFLFMKLNYISYTKLAEAYHIETQKRIFKHIQENPEVLEKIPKGRVLDTFADDIRWIVDAVDSATQVAIRAVQLVVIFIIFAKYDLYVGGVAILVDALYMVLLNENARRVAKYYGGARRQEDGAIGAFNELMEGDSEEKRRESEEKLKRSYYRWKGEYRKKRKALTDRYTRWPLIPYLGKILLYAILAKFVVEGRMGIDQLVLLVGYFELTISCMDTLQGKMLELSNYGVRIRRIKKVLGL